MKNDSLLLTAGLLGVAAYLFAENPASASQSSGSSGVNGFANNNPGNIRYNPANQWKGQTGQQNGFCVFSDISYGVRAMGILLTNYYNAGCTTITQIVSKYAPASENDTAAYITAVSEQTGDDADEPLTWPQDELALVQAIIQHEQGYNPLNDSDVQSYLQS